ncbi:hypothetical protein PR048_021496 [Dryococelus australis]|uniref:Uncharacterized protein n=1 Tax=Dryococelus australis TaxID=614101 RepID=A0ABQ9GYC9_9NEOP|nr:hypothetical protein PR048_021496 [Dryococelus australis]
MQLLSRPRLRSVRVRRATLLRASSAQSPLRAKLSNSRVASCRRASTPGSRDVLYCKLPGNVCPRPESPLFGSYATLAQGHARIVVVHPIERDHVCFYRVVSHEVTALDWFTLQTLHRRFRQSYTTFAGVPGSSSHEPSSPSRHRRCSPTKRVPGQLEHVASERPLELHAPNCTVVPGPESPEMWWFRQSGPYFINPYNNLHESCTIIKGQEQEHRWFVRFHLHSDNASCERFPSGPAVSWQTSWHTLIGDSERRSDMLLIDDAILLSRVAGLEIASQNKSSVTHKTPYDRVKRCRERKINIKAPERVNVARAAYTVSTKSQLTPEPKMVNQGPGRTLSLTGYTKLWERALCLIGYGVPRLCMPIGWAAIWRVGYQSLIGGRLSNTSPASDAILLAWWAGSPQGARGRLFVKSNAQCWQRALRAVQSSGRVVGSRLAVDSSPLPGCEDILSLLSAALSLSSRWAWASTARTSRCLLTHASSPQSRKSVSLLTAHKLADALSQIAAVVPRRSGIAQLPLKVARDAKLSALNHSPLGGPHVVFILQSRTFSAIQVVLGKVMVMETTFLRGKNTGEEDSKSFKATDAFRCSAAKKIVMVFGSCELDEFYILNEPGGNEVHLLAELFTGNPSCDEMANRPNDNTTHAGVTVAQRLACSPLTKANRAESPAGSLRIFACRNCGGRYRWSAGFLGDLPFPPLILALLHTRLNHPHRLSKPRRYVNHDCVCNIASFARQRAKSAFHLEVREARHLHLGVFPCDPDSTNVRRDVTVNIEARLALTLLYVDCLTIFQIEHRVRWRSGNLLDSHSRGPGFDSRSGNPVPETTPRGRRMLTWSISSQSFSPAQLAPSLMTSLLTRHMRFSGVVVPVGCTRLLVGCIFVYVPTERSCSGHWTEDVSTESSPFQGGLTDPTGEPTYGLLVIMEGYWCFEVCVGRLFQICENLARSLPPLSSAVIPPEGGRHERMKLQYTTIYPSFVEVGWLNTDVEDGKRREELLHGELTKVDGREQEALTRPPGEKRAAVDGIKGF